MVQNRREGSHSDSNMEKFRWETNNSQVKSSGERGDSLLLENSPCVEVSSDFFPSPFFFPDRGSVGKACTQTPHGPLSWFEFLYGGRVSHILLSLEGGRRHGIRERKKREEKRNQKLVK